MTVPVPLRQKVAVPVAAPVPQDWPVILVPYSVLWWIQVAADVPYLEADGCGEVFSQ
jgi:hypothetical protein